MSNKVFVAITIDCTYVHYGILDPELETVSVARVDGEFPICNAGCVLGDFDFVECPIDESTGAIKNWDNYGEIISYVWDQLHLGDSEEDDDDITVMMSEHPLTPKADRARIADLMFALEINALDLVPRPELEMTKLVNDGTGLMVEADTNVVTVTALWQGNALLDTVQSVTIKIPDTRLSLRNVLNNALNSVPETIAITEAVTEAMVKSVTAASFDQRRCLYNSIFVDLRFHGYMMAIRHSLLQKNNCPVVENCSLDNFLRNNNQKCNGPYNCTAANFQYGGSFISSNTAWFGAEKLLGSGKREWLYLTREEWDQKGGKAINQKQWTAIAKADELVNMDSDMFDI